MSGRLTPGRSVPVTLAQVVNGRLVGIVGGRTTATGTYRLSAALAPGTYQLQAITATASSRVYGLVVPQPVVPACSTKSVRTSHVDSAHCLFSAYKRSDWAAVSNYALPPVVAELKRWRSQPYNLRFSFEGCGLDRGYASTSSTGFHCEFYWHPDPDSGAIHGTAVQLGMDRYFRAQTVETFG